MKINIPLYGATLAFESGPVLDAIVQRFVHIIDKDIDLVEPGEINVYKSFRDGHRKLLWHLNIVDFNEPKGFENISDLLNQPSPTLQAVCNLFLTSYHEHGADNYRITEGLFEPQQNLYNDVTNELLLQSATPQGIAAYLDTHRN